TGRGDLAVLPRGPRAIPAGARGRGQGDAYLAPPAQRGGAGRGGGTGATAGQPGGRGWRRLSDAALPARGRKVKPLGRHAVVEPLPVHGLDPQPPSDGAHSSAILTSYGRYDSGNSSRSLGWAAFPL